MSEVGQAALRGGVRILQERMPSLGKPRQSGGKPWDTRLPTRTGQLLEKRDHVWGTGVFRALCAVQRGAMELSQGTVCEPQVGVPNLTYGTWALLGKPLH